MISLTASSLRSIPSLTMPLSRGRQNVEGEAVFRRLVTEENLFPHHLGGDEILRPADVARDPLLFTVAGRR